MKDLLKLISNENYITVNRDLIKEIGLDETVLLSELCSEQYYWKSNNKLGKDGFFFSTVENIEKQIGFKKKKQLTLLNKLKSLDLIQVKYHDMPKKRYIKINIFELEKIQEKYNEERNKKRIKLNEYDYDIINNIFFNYEFAKELKQPFADYLLVRKQNGFNVTKQNVRGIANSLKKYKSYSIEEQKKMIKKAASKKWSNFFEVKDHKKDLEKQLSDRYKNYYNNLKY